MQLRNGKIIGDYNLDINTLKQPNRVVKKITPEPGTDFLSNVDSNRDYTELVVCEPTRDLPVQVATIKKLLELVDQAKKDVITNTKLDRRYVLSFVKSMFWYIHQVAERKKKDCTFPSILDKQHFRRVCIQKIAELIDQTQPTDKRNTPEVMLYFHTEVMPLCAKLIACTHS